MKVNMFGTGVLSTMVLLVSIRTSISATTTTTQRTSTSNSESIWSKYSIPNPQIDINSCGRNGKSSFVCDPDNIITSSEADLIDYAIESLRTGTGDCVCDNCARGYQGYQAGVVILNKVRIKPNPSSDEKRYVAADYAEYLREYDWEFGRCDDDLIILISKQDRIVYTATGDLVRPTLTDQCVDDIFQENKQLFTDGDYGAGTIALLDEYRSVLVGDRSCPGSNKLTYVIVGVVLGVGAFIAIIVCFLCCTRGKCEGGGGSYGHHWTPSYHHDSGGWGGGGGGGGGGSGGGGGEF